jgi:hypothetical protein
MCIPGADAMLWALVARIRDHGYLPTDDDLRALLGSRCPRERVREVMAREAERHPDRPFALALARLDEVR